MGNSGGGFGINSLGDVVGDYTDSSGARHGFIRYRDGRFTAQLTAPGDTTQFTRARGINASRLVVGDYRGDAFHGFFYKNGVFTSYDVAPGPVTTIFGINNAGSFVGEYGDGINPTQGFVNIGGEVTLFAVQDALATFPTGINAQRAIVGEYVDADNVTHGFFRSVGGDIEAPFDYPESISTNLRSINAKGWIVGRYADTAGKTHGFLFVPPANFISYDVPGSTRTAINGLNDEGLVTGSYSDANGIAHGFIARITSPKR